MKYKLFDNSCIKYENLKLIFIRVPQNVISLVVLGNNLDYYFYCKVPELCWSFAKFWQQKLRTNIFSRTFLVIPNTTSKNNLRFSASALHYFFMFTDVQWKFRKKHVLIVALRYTFNFIYWKNEENANSLKQNFLRRFEIKFCKNYHIKPAYNTKQVSEM